MDTVTRTVTSEFLSWRFCLTSDCCTDGRLSRKEGVFGGSKGSLGTNPESGENADNVNAERSTYN